MQKHVAAGADAEAFADGDIQRVDKREQMVRCVAMAERTGERA